MAFASIIQPVMKPHCGRKNSHLAYLEPPHLHDPSSISSVASLPRTTQDTLPTDVQLALYNLQQSTSIVYASLIRLQDLLEERFDRLMPSGDLDGDMTFSESSFFNYTNSLCAERSYLLSDAHPDWRHKASLAHVAIQPFTGLSIDTIPANATSPSTVGEWWDYLQSAVESWCDYARVVHIPDFEDTIGEYEAILRQIPALAADLGDTPIETPFAISTPTTEKGPESFQLYEIRGRDFASSLLSDDTVPSKSAILGLESAIEVDELNNMSVQEFPLKVEGPIRDERKDSGVGFSN